MIKKVYQICVGGVGTDWFYTTYAAERAVEDYKKDCVEEYERNFGRKPDMTIFDGVDAILYDKYYED